MEETGDFGEEMFGETMIEEEPLKKRGTIKKKVEELNEEIREDVDIKVKQLKSVKAGMLRSYIFVIIISLIASLNCKKKETM